MPPSRPAPASPAPCGAEAEAAGKRDTPRPVAAAEISAAFGDKERDRASGAAPALAGCDNRSAERQEKRWKTQRPAGPQHRSRVAQEHDGRSANGEQSPDTPPPPLSLSLSPWMCPGDGGRPPPTATMPPRKVFPVAPRFSSLRPAASRPRSPGERRTRRFSRAAPLRLRAPLPLLPRPPQLIKSQENGLPPHAGGRRAMAF